MKFAAAGGQEVTFDLGVTWTEDQLSEFSVKETTTFPNMRMTLIVRRPDYLGASKWEFRHGKRSIRARIEDSEWLRRFQLRQVDVRPGDALACLVTIEHGYGHDNELIEERYVVTKIERVLENQATQPSLLDRPSTPDDTAF